MKRAFVFLLLGPASVVAAWFYAVSSNEPWEFVRLVAMFLFAFTFLVAALAALVDGLLARALPASGRVFLIAFIGAVIPASVIFAFTGCVLPQSFSVPFAIGGALCMGTCSLLSNDYRDRQSRALPVGAGE